MSFHPRRRVGLRGRGDEACSRAASEDAEGAAAMGMAAAARAAAIQAKRRKARPLGAELCREVGGGGADLVESPVGGGRPG